MKFLISAQHTIWCENCNEWQYLDNLQKRRQNKEAISKGWRVVNIRGSDYTLCPACVKKGCFPE